jgi:hypothetical protein
MAEKPVKTALVDAARISVERFAANGFAARSAVVL